MARCIVDLPCLRQIEQNLFIIICLSVSSYECVGNGRKYCVEIVKNVKDFEYLRTCFEKANQVNSSSALDGRQWIGDVGSKYIISQGSKAKLISSTPVDQLFSVNPVPYVSARISHSQFTYIFQVSAGPKFIRLHFCPASYPGLYHTLEGDPGAHVTGKKYRFPIDESIALELVQRLNVGGSSMLSIEDTGMFREWSEDSNHLLESSRLPVSTTIRIKYRNTPTYSAPQKVYQTSGSMFLDQQANKTFNFMWKLPVDLGFSNGVAVYRDYVLTMEGDRMVGKCDMIIALCPHNHSYEWRTTHIDAILKGLEVFKLSNPDNNLAGVNLVPVASGSIFGNPNPRKFVFASCGNAIAIGVVIFLCVLNIIIYKLRILGDKFGEKNFSSLPSEELCRRFSLAEIQFVTNNFNDELVIGRGGFGKVYKALLIDGEETTVAIKRLNSNSKQGAHEFWTEIVMLSKLRHMHLLSLIGYCEEGHEMILVYEYMEHGTLADHLYKINTCGNICHLSWEQRLNIFIDAARGLDYLHTVGIKACDLPRKGLGDVMIALMLFSGYVLVCCCGGYWFLLQLPKPLIMVTDRASFM
ncbi:hypothetical protein TEA_004989 [Camellia sinensis var. sinensis]|uniref:Protein kinase domain-containing protein n=1 Tax=Camellia sinensis var. sinensis TaxID=542762 RepID=A0A4S4EE03_CAMSN|nr:hypothetical protein TEA_004989 [Camellia sinensis var. sinensis]